jgi:hypothetical protein
MTPAPCVALGDLLKPNFVKPCGFQTQHCDSRAGLHSRKKPAQITIPTGLREQSMGMLIRLLPVVVHIRRSVITVGPHPNRAQESVGNP